MTSANNVALTLAHSTAAEIFTKESAGSLRAIGSLVSPIMFGVVNGFGTFTVVPDGSKLGWPESTAADRAREDFLCWLREQDSVDYAYVQYGGEDGIEAALLASSDNEC